MHILWSLPNHRVFLCKNAFKQEDLGQVVMLEQKFTQSDWWVGFELSASEIATQFPTTITKTQTVKTQVDH